MALAKPDAEWNEYKRWASAKEKLYKMGLLLLLAGIVDACQRCHLFARGCCSPGATKEWPGDAEGRGSSKVAVELATLLVIIQSRLLLTWFVKETLRGILREGCHDLGPFTKPACGHVIHPNVRHCPHLVRSSLFTQPLCALCTDRHTGPSRHWRHLLRGHPCSFVILVKKKAEV